MSDGVLAVTGAVDDAGVTAFVVSDAVDGLVATTGDGLETTGAVTEGVTVGLTTGLLAVVVGGTAGFIVEEVVVAGTGLVTGTVAIEVFD